MAQVFFEKGYENVYLVSGGIEKFAEDFPYLCEGKVQPVSSGKEETKERMELSKKKHDQCKESPRRYWRAREEMQNLIEVRGFSWKWMKMFSLRDR